MRINWKPNLCACLMLAFASLAMAQPLTVGEFLIDVGVPAKSGESLQPAEQAPELSVLPGAAREAMPVEIRDITVVVPDPTGGHWIGSEHGAAHWNGKEWRYRQGRRWLPGDHVRNIRVDAQGNALFLTDAGLGRIERQRTTLAKKAALYENEIDKRHRRTQYEYVLEVNLKRPGDTSEWVQHDSDNDGLWTGMYGAAQCFAYGASKDPAAKERATTALRALAFLSEVTQGGAHSAPPGFPARSILPTAGRDPNDQDSPERDLRTRENRDKKWKLLAPRWPVSADGKWYWKTDTSSDELDGHYFLYGLYYDLVAETEAEREEVRRVVRRVTDHLLANDFALVDHDGKKTRWAVFGPDDLNLDPTWWVERGLNSLSMLTYLRVAQHVTGDAKYGRVARTLIDKHGYASNMMFPKVTAGAGGGNQSDDEMAFMNYYHLLKYEPDLKLRSMAAMSLASYWELEKPECNPFFNFVAASQLKGISYSDSHDTYDLSPAGEWLAESVETLKRFPLNLIDWPMKNSHRRDLVPLPAYIRPDREPGTLFLRKDGRVIPVDERVVFHWNLDPYRVDSEGQGMRLADGTSFLLPYYMGLYEGFLRE